MGRTRAKSGLLARLTGHRVGRRLPARTSRSRRTAARNVWTWLTVFGPRAAFRHWRLKGRRRSRGGRGTSRAGWSLWTDRRRGVAAGGLTAATFFTVVVALFGLRVTPEPPAPAEVVTAGTPPLPVLPVIGTDFDGVPLETYLSSPTLMGFERDELLSSAVLRDPDFARAVHWWVGYWTGPASRWFPGFLERMAERGGTVDSALATHGFPPSLRYLPLIESGYDPRVTSRTGAVGMWQLMPSTARGLGLQVSALVDERQHPERSTEAALDYLGSLRGEFDSWFLTLAAYNSGPTRVRSILRRYAPDTPHSDSLFWALRDRFPAETREFVPKLYGAMWVASRPEAYGYGLAPDAGLPTDN